MATKTVTIDSGEWVYPDVSGINHTVTAAETFTFELTDVSTTGATYRMDGGSVKCDDGCRVYIKRGESINFNLFPKDAKQGTVVRNDPGGWVMLDPYSGVEQIWKVASSNINDVDAPTTITATFEDQYGNTFTWTAVTIS
jgi:hypothetical protein